MFDRSFLPEAEFEFVLVSDTHYMLDPGPEPVEFTSRRRQSARAERVLRLAGHLPADFVVHLGDLVQEYPETERYRQAMSEARAQLDRCGVRPFQVAGNQDIGDKPDPTMPTGWVTPQSLAAFHDLFGRSWYSWDRRGVHFVVLNSQLLNTTLPEAREQRRWLEADLAAHRDRRIFLFFHLGLFLKEEHEPALGHYDNIAEPDRGWLINLIRQYQVELAFSGHSHFAFFNRIGPTRYYNVVSTSFTRPGFSHLFAAAPPPDQGRDDAPKLGFYLIRGDRAGTSVHFIRTYGNMAPVKPGKSGPYLISRISRELPASPLGLSLLQPLTQTVDLPLVWPSAIRQPVRNDYPFLSCLELGVRQVRLPATDLADPLQRQRLEYLREEGVGLNASWLWAEPFDLAEALRPHEGLLAGVEVQLLGSLWPDEACCRQLRRISLPLSLGPLLPNEPVPGKQHLRSRLGYLHHELGQVNQRLAQSQTPVERALCLVPAQASPWQVITTAPEPAGLSHIGGLDWLVDFATTSERFQLNRAAEAIFALAVWPASRLFFSPLVDLDRTMDVAYGLLDGLHNPRPVFNVVRCLNTLLFSRPESRRPHAAPERAGLKILGLQGPTATLWLLLPEADHPEKVRLHGPALLNLLGQASEARCFFLEQGLSHELNVAAVSSKGLAVEEAMLLRVEPNAAA